MPNPPNPASPPDARTSLDLFGPSAAAPLRRTYVCFGTPYGGTSMVAGALRGLGIPMGDNLDLNVEDPMFNFDHARMPMPDFIARVRTAIAHRNDQHAVWGWKYPRAALYLDPVLPLLINPRFVVVYRDPVAGSMRAANRAAGTARTLAIKKAMLMRLRTGQANLSLALHHDVPTLLISHQKALELPHAFLDELAAFTGQTLPADLRPLLAFMAPGSYKNPSMVTNG